MIFGFQHDARFRSRSEDGRIETISFFDNSARSNGHQGGGLDELHDYSSGKIVQINHTDNTATLLHTVVHPDKVLAASQGNLQLLPNGNSFVNWGQAGSVTEFNSKGEPIFNAYLDSGELGQTVQSYRGFRYNWTGFPIETPAIISLKEGNHVNIYVSWNGDTETKRWKFYSVDSGKASGSDQRVLLGEVARKSFETRYTVDTGKVSSTASPTVFAEALDGKGGVLSRTNLVFTRAGVTVKGKVEEDVGSQKLLKNSA